MCLYFHNMLIVVGCQMGLIFAYLPCYNPINLCKTRRKQRNKNYSAYSLEHQLNGFQLADFKNLCFPSIGLQALLI